MASAEPAEPMFALVVGTGYTGLRVLSMLPADAVAGVNRSPVNTDRQLLLLDVDSATELPLELPARYAIIYTIPPTATPADTRLKRFLPMLSPTRFIYISTTGVYGDSAGATVTESSALRPSNQRAERRVAAERLLTDWARTNDCELLVLRAPGIYGPGRLGVERIRSGVPVLAEEDANPGNRIHADDLARCCIAALSEEVPAGIYNVGDGDHRSTTAFTNEVARQLGLPLPAQISLAAARKQFSSERMAFLSDARIVDTTRMREVLGVIPRYANPEDGISASL